MAKNSRTHVKHGSDYTNYHFYKLMSYMSVSESVNQLDELKLMKDRIDRAFQDLVTEVESNIANAENKQVPDGEIQSDSIPM
jgi:hypothetical protein